MIQLRELEVIFTRKFVIILTLVLFIQVMMGSHCGDPPKPDDWAYRSIQSKKDWWAAHKSSDTGESFPFRPEGFLSQLRQSGVTTDFGGLDEIITGALQPDGKIVVAGVANSSSFGLARYNSNGTLDSTFGTGGKVTTRFFNSGGADGQICTALAIQPDGKIITVGVVTADRFGSHQWDFGLARYNADGSPDTTFGAGGKVITDVQGTGREDIALALALQPDGKILAVGSTGNPPSAARYNFALVRYNSNGALDTTFGAGGKVITDFNNDDDLASSLVIQPDGKMVVGGWTFSRSTAYSSYDFALARYDSSGNLDNSFGSGGKVVSDFGSATGDPRDDVITGMVLQPDGKILAAGAGEPNRNTTSADFVIGRFNPNGSLDAAFGAGGKVITDFNESTDMANSIALQPDGKFVVAGVANGSMRNGFDSFLQVSFIHENAPRASDFAVARYNPNGSLDSSFGTGGKGTTDFFGSVDAATKVLIRPDGNILVAGFAQTTPFVFAQFQGAMDFASVLYFGKYLQRRKLNDFDGDGKAEFAVFRPAIGTWFILNSFTNSFRAAQFGAAGDKLAAGDFDGDGLADVAVYRGGVWYITQSSDNSFRAVQFGESSDKPVPDDYDGDGKTDVAVFRPGNGTWYLLRSSQGFTGVQFGTNGDIPVNGDYDGDGRSDISVYRPGSGIWYRLNSSNGAFNGFQFGTAEDKPVVGDYDADGIYDLAVFRPSIGVWYLLKSREGFSASQFGLSSDLPVPGDYDGDQRTDIAVFRPSSGTWYGLQSSNGFSAVQFGASGDVPVPSAFVP